MIVQDRWKALKVDMDEPVCPDNCEDFMGQRAATNYQNTSLPRGEQAGFRQVLIVWNVVTHGRILPDENHFTQPSDCACGR